MRFFPILFIFLFLLSCENGQRKDIELVRIRLNLEKGRTYNLLMTINSDIKQTLMGSRQEQKQIIKMKYSFLIDNVNRIGTADIDVKIESISMNQSGMGVTLIYDSEDSTKNNNKLISRIYDNIVGSNIRLRITPDGKVLSVSGIKEMYDKMLASFEASPVPELKQFPEQILDQFGEDAIKEMMEKAFRIYPEKPVKIGDSWDLMIKVTKGFPLKLMNTWTLMGINKDTLILGLKGNISTNEEAPLMEMAGMKMNFSFNGTQNGIVKVDKYSGWIIEQNYTQNLSGELIIEDPSMAKDEIRAPISIKSKISMKPYDK